MKIGIIGAGRVGCSIGKYLRTKDIELAGYYDVDLRRLRRLRSLQGQRALIR